ncbi:hypothetical protein [Herbiconiux flava]|uniref:Uncharacterized protein n=1 Tax=Herbiconiux flava TaxID=881268 RepID=A0A852SSZ0_9MICO|nr:hypothetical protein [Herbiconiux flava]NYD71999.1 hypothetical protein [Herbiconiux flava]GLK18038.1 hypothetical protein GCM10017602_25200 [Herbiconiux flava]
MHITKSFRHTGRGAQLRPDIMPVLSAGRHRSPRSGACFMEFASFLAGEKWSDHPACTHAGLAQMARAVNDMSSNEGRGRLSTLIPSVIGLTSDDPRLELVLAITAVTVALPDAPLDRQHALAVGGLVCQEALHRLGGGPVEVDAPFVEALASAPEAERWARRFLDRNQRWGHAEITERQTHTTIAMAVDGVRSACVPRPDDRLYAMLAESIALCERFVAAAAAAPSAPSAPGAAAPVAAVPETRRAVQV